ncbi:MAG: metalloregulator ArsR/SmtB family transcription factor [Bacilli bacterium]|nr:metalloregulator ArsR/SmtB family transcription factor [Bacilli bacterium]
MIDIKTLEEMKKIYHIMDDITRLRILHTLFDDCGCVCDKDCANCECLHCKRERSVSDIVTMTNLEQSLVSHQLKVLKDSGLIAPRKEGTKVYYSLADGHVRALLKMGYEHVVEER